MVIRRYTTVEPSVATLSRLQEKQGPAAQVIRGFGRFYVGPVSLGGWDG